MYTAKARVIDEQWIEPPEPALDRYLLRSCHRATNDNRRPFFGIFRPVQFGACMALASVLSLIGALVR